MDGRNMIYNRYAKTADGAVCAEFIDGPYASPVRFYPAAGEERTVKYVSGRSQSHYGKCENDGERCGNKKEMQLRESGISVSRKGKSIRVMLRLAVILLIIAVSAALFFGTSSRTASAESERTDQVKYYKSIVVEEGDTLWDIARENMTREYSSVREYIHEVKKINHIHSDDIYAGEKICIPYYASAPEQI